MFLFKELIGASVSVLMEILVTTVVAHQMMLKKSDNAFPRFRRAHFTVNGLIMVHAQEAAVEEAKREQG